MPSGAGHDAQMLARVCPTAMIFVPSANGLSHNIAEYTAPADLERGANVLLHVILARAGQNDELMKLTITAAIHARWGHRVDGLIHTHAWTLEATVEGDPDCDKVYPVDDLEYLLTATVEPWHGHYLTHEDVGAWKGLPAARVGPRADGRGDRPPRLRSSSTTSCPG